MSHEGAVAGRRLIGCLPICRVIALFLLLSVPAMAETVPERLNRFRTETLTPGVVLAILHSSEDAPRVYASGLANVETGTPVTAESVFRVGSVTKVFMAVLTMQLVERGVLSLDATLEKYIPELPDAARITVRDLLQHSSGLADFLNMESFAQALTKPWSPQELLTLIAGAPLKFQPGQHFSYSNSNYLILGLLIERAGGIPYAEALARDIAGPLAMTATRPGDDRSLVPDRVAGYDVDHQVDPPRLVNPRMISIVPPGASGGLMSRPSDLVRLAWLSRLLSADSLKLMETPGRVAEGPGPRLPARAGQPEIAVDYGLGFELTRIGAMARPLVSKLGSIPGFTCWLVLVPEQGLALAAAANNEQAAIPLLRVLDDMVSGRVQLPGPTR